eukprot:CAMPEP_0170203100 /NCGR_PEP_ID=MMETSP0116_2-20130129/1047_1 /TAXON_ID=400756 /ORGANISM="Durinskia baltica, Strain CSIRO CS-38" /LENGTH=337 /DNA_ID=CAMNT_0010453397 /DNA_START=245 /DNA_END=1259 /DNA_ORIENTATION=-
MSIQVLSLASSSMGDRKYDYDYANSPLLTGNKGSLNTAVTGTGTTIGSGSPLLSAIHNARLLNAVGQEQGIVSHLRAAQPQERQDIETLLNVRAKQMDETLHALERAYALKNYSDLLASTLQRSFLLPSSLSSRLAMAALVASPRLSSTPWTDALPSASTPTTVSPKEDLRPHSSSNSSITTGTASATTVSTRSPKVLYMDCDGDSLSEYQCLIRQQMELFEATEEDAAASVQGRNKQILKGQVGIRCRHCAPRRTKGSMYFPTKLDRIYQAAQNLSAFHLCGGCAYVPEDVRKRILILRERKSPAGGGKRYWAEGVRCLGVKEEKGGLLFSSLSSK